MLLSVVIIVLIIITQLFQGANNQKQPAPDPFPSPTTTQISYSETAETNTGLVVPGNTALYRESTARIQKEEAPLTAKEAAIGRLLDQIPYKGTAFQIDHDYSAAQYIVTISQDKKQEGNQEFDEFLKKNGIESRDWFRKELLVIQYE